MSKDSTSSSSSSSSSNSSASLSNIRSLLTETQKKDLDNQLLKAAMIGDPETIGNLVQQGADVNAANNRGDTALHGASSRRHTKTVQLLIDNGANVYAANNRGDTALHGASIHGYTETAMVLLQHGANPNAVNRWHNTPLHEAARNERTETAMVLLQHSANPSTKNNDDYTALDVSENDDIRSLLIEYINFQKNLKSIFDKMVKSFSEIKTARNGKEEASASNPSTDLDKTLKAALEAAKNRFLETAKDLASKNKDLFSPEFHPFNMALDNKGNSVLHLIANEALKLGDGPKRNQYLGLLATLAQESGSEKIQEMINRATIISKELRPSVASNIEEIIVSYLYDNEIEREKEKAPTSQTIIDDNLATALHLAANKGYLIASNQATSPSLTNNPKEPGIMGRFLGAIFSSNLDTTFWRILNTIFCRNSAAEEESHPATNMAAASSSSTYSGSKEEEKTAPAARGNNTDNQTPTTFVQNPSATATSSKYQQNQR